MSTNVQGQVTEQRIYLADLEEPVAALTGAIDGSDLDAPLPLTIVLIVVVA